MCTAKQLSPSRGGIGYKNNPKHPVHFIILHLHQPNTPSLNTPFFLDPLLLVPYFLKAKKALFFLTH